uniref:Ras-specific guanine nucleotide-releasing factor 2-like n=1 Tax=Sinocyclocheilus anshuiensis TaxID=1608454 RepID=A0A671PP50_9TELE
MQKSVRYNEGHALYLSMVARKEGIKRGFLSKKAAENNRWNEKYFALYQNVLFCFENEQSTRPSGIYLLEGCTCERIPAPKVSTVGKESSDKQFAAQETFYFFTFFLQTIKDFFQHSLNTSFKTTAFKHLKKFLYFLFTFHQFYASLLNKSINLLKKITCRTLEHERISEFPDIKKIKKVQSFMRGWLCRRKWKIIVQDYICSPHAESMRKRNQIVFNMVEAETEYVLQLSILVNCFLRPLRMAASSKKPPISHDDVSSIFLNSETIMFLHEIFHQGLKARIANWPTLLLADLFDILLPMLNIYQEFVRNHQYSLQVLANCKQNRDFDKLLKQYEANAACEDRMLETFLTYPMFQIPRYIITLHELLAHTPHEHVERKSLEFAKSKLEELSKMMHDEVSDTENIRKNLAIERMIVEGCDILLDTSQTFVRQGSLIQLPSVEKGKLSKVRLGSLSLRKEAERQCFLFTKHFLICTRTSGGKLHLLKGGMLSLIECALIEELDANDEDCKCDGFNRLEFKIVVEPADGPSFAVVLLAPSRQEKAAWTSDMSQCIDNIRCNGLMTSVFEDNSKVTVPHMIKSDARLHKDDVDICFSKTLNSCKVPQIRYASVERLLERLTDLRFLSIDFLNTFLHTYRIFTTAAVVMDKLSDIYKKPFTSLPVRLEYLPLYGEHLNNKSPNLSRKFSSPLPVSIPSRTSSPIHPRKLSLSSPVSCKGGALDLSTATSSAASSPMSPYTPGITSPPPTCTRAPLDLSRGPSSPELSPSTPEESGELPRIDAFCGKLRRSIRRGESRSGSANLQKSPDSSRCAVSPASAFATATAAAGHTALAKSYDKEFLIRRAATNRVLNVLRHWVSKHSQDFEMNAELTTAVIALLEEVLRDPDLLPQERKAAANILSALSQEEQDDSQLKIEDIVHMVIECFESLSAMELAEQITLLDHIVFWNIPYEEFLGQGWMKTDKNEKTPYIMKTSQHFNNMSNLVASQIMAPADVSSRAASIEKWLAVADICRCLNNYNGVLEITSALNRSAIYRLKKTWAKVCKQVSQNSIGFCNPPCVPYLGMYLTDLAFIEEGTPNFTEEGLVNFSKMRMVFKQFFSLWCL